MTTFRCRFELGVLPCGGPPVQGLFPTAVGAAYAAAADAAIQVGLVNIIPPNPWFTELPDRLAPGMIIVNWRF